VDIQIEEAAEELARRDGAIDTQVVGLTEALLAER
jgi:hypothetical protein